MRGNFQPVQENTVVHWLGRTFNDVAKLVQAHGASPRTGTPAVGNFLNSQTVITVQNKSGGTMDRFDVAGIGDPLYDSAANLPEFQNNLVLEVTTPATALHLGKYVVLLETIPDGKFGIACMAGVVSVQIDAGVVEYDYAEVTDGQAYLTSAAVGSARVLWRELGSGTKWAVVRLGEAGGSGSPVMLKADEHFLADDTFYDAKFYGADASVGGIVQVKRVPTKPARAQTRGFLGVDKEGEAMFVVSDTYFVQVSPDDILPSPLSSQLIAFGPGPLEYNILDPGAAESLELKIYYTNSIVLGGVGNELELDNDELAPGNWEHYGTNGGGTKGWFVDGVLVSANDTTPGFLNGKLADGNGIEFTEAPDGGNEVLTIAAYVTKSIEFDSGDDNQLQLVNDETTPGNNKQYGTNGSGTKGWYDADDDEKVKASANDTTAGYLDAKLGEGLGIDLVEAPDGGNEVVTISAFVDDDDIEFDVGGAISIKDDGVHDHHINADVAGNGLTQGVDGQLEVDPKQSIEFDVTDGEKIHLVSDETSPGNLNLYSTGSAGGKGWNSIMELLSTLPGYDAGKTQILSHVSGTLTWQDTDTCS